MQQTQLFHDDIYEALRTDIQALGGAKRVGSMFWPEKSADKAGENLNNCLNTTRAEKLDAEQIMLVVREARKINSFSAISFICGDGGFSAPQPVEPEDEAAQLQRDFIQSVKAQAEMLKRMEKLNLPTASLQAVG